MCMATSATRNKKHCVSGAMQIQHSHAGWNADCAMMCFSVLCCKDVFASRLGGKPKRLRTERGPPTARPVRFPTKLSSSP